MYLLARVSVLALALNFASGLGSGFVGLLSKQRGGEKASCGVSLSSGCPLRLGLDSRWGRLDERCIDADQWCDGCVRQGERCTLVVVEGERCRLHWDNGW